MEVKGVDKLCVFQNDEPRVLEVASEIIYDLIGTEPKLAAMSGRP